jgi:hypothetical protein
MARGKKKKQKTGHQSKGGGDDNEGIGVPINPETNSGDESATQRENCCMKLSDRNLHRGCTLSLKSFLQQK